MADPNLDHVARQMGFHDFATYQAYQSKRRAMQLDNGLNGRGAPQGQAGTSAPKNWLQSIPLSPAYLMNYVSDKLSGAGL